MVDARVLYFSDTKGNNMYRRNVLGLSVISALGLAMLPVSAVAQQKSIKEQLVGTWTATSWEQANKDGTKFQRFGANRRASICSTRTVVSS